MKFVVFSLILLVSVPVAWAQMNAAPVADHVEIMVNINRSGDARVVHVLESHSQAQQIQPIAGAIENVTVRDESGRDLQYAMITDGAILVFPSDTDVRVEYDIRGALSKNGNIWGWDFFYPRSVLFSLPPDLATIYANDRPVHLDGDEQIRCHGCQMRLEYTFQEPVSHHDVWWEEHHFLVTIRSHDTVEEIGFAQSAKSLDFDIAGGEFVTVVIPTDLLGGPYEVLLEDEKVWFHKYKSNDTHTWINFRPETGGWVTIVGTTVIPEFPLAILVMAAAALPLLVISQNWNRRRKNHTHLSGNRKADTLWYN